MAREDKLEKRINELEDEVVYLKGQLRKTERVSSRNLTTDLTDFTLNNPIETLWNRVKNLGVDFQKTISEINVAATEAAAKFGTGLKNYESISQEIAKALPDLARLNISTFEVGEMQERFTKNARETSVILSSDALKNIGILDKLNTDGAAIAANFKTSAQSVSGMLDELEVAGQVAADYGVNASKIFDDIETTMQSTNQYRFENGVEGISRMAAQTAIMGIEFKNVVSFADRVMNPQGAIETVAALQRLGVAASNLQDPFKLMYMAQSDMEGLTEEIGKTVSNLATFNRETGKLEIPPSARMAMKEIGDTLGLSAEEMNRLVSQQAKFNEMASDFEGLGVSEEDQMMIANLVEFSKDRQQFEVKVGGQTKAITELSSEDLKVLKERPKTLEDAAMQQLSVTQIISGQIDSIIKSMTTSVAATKLQFDTERVVRAGAQTGGETISEAVQAFDLRTIFNNFTKDVSTSFGDIIKSFETLDFSIFTKISESSKVNLEEGFNRFELSYKESLMKIPIKFDTIVGDDNLYIPLVEKLKTGFSTSGDKIINIFDEFLKELELDLKVNPIPKTQEILTPPVQEQQNIVQSGINEARRNVEIEVEDFVIKSLPEDTIKVIGGTNIPPAGADITNILNNQTNNTQALTSIQPIAPREIITPQVQANATPVANEQKELRVKFDPFIVKLEGDGKSIEMALQDNVVRDKIIDMVGKAMILDYNTMGRPILGSRA